MRFRSLLLGTALAFAMAVPAVIAPQPAEAGWIAVSVQGNGWGYGVGNSEDEARGNAIFQCELANSSCSRGTAVEEWWWLAAVVCNGVGFTAGSQWSAQQAINNAVQKGNNAGRWNCSVVGTW